MKTERFDKFLTNYNFYSNNVDFRIKSSKALEKWKNVQAFQLNQLVNGRISFEKDRREILLLKYDLWSRFLYEVESYCIELSSKSTDSIISKSDIMHIMDLIDKISEKYRSILLHEYPEKFDKLFTEIWFRIHKFPNKYLKRELLDLIGNNLIVVFIKLVDHLSEILQYTLFEIHELDSFFNTPDVIKSKKDMSFLIVSDFSRKALNVLDENLICNRLKIYKEYFDIKEIYLKNYTDKFISPRLIDEIKACGVEINYEYSLCK